MGRKKKQVEPVIENSQNSQGEPLVNDSKRLDNLENKLDKILNSMALGRSCEETGRMSHSSCNLTSAFCPQFYEEIGRQRS